MRAVLVVLVALALAGPGVAAPGKIAIRDQVRRGSH